MSAARTALAALGLAVLAAAAFGAAAPASLNAQSGAPRVDSMVIRSSAGNDSTYTRGDTIKVRVYWDRRVDVSQTTVTAGLVIGSTNRTAIFGGDPGTIGYPASSSNSVGNVWIDHYYLVQQSDLDTDGISVVSVGSGELENFNDGTTANTDVTGKTITNAAAHKVDGALGLPRVTGVTISSDAGNDSLYVTRDTIQVSVVFDSTVTVTGTPQLALTIGSQTRQANYASGTGSDTLVFRYVVVAADADADGISIAANALTLNGGTIRDGSVNAALGLGSHAITNAAAHKVGYAPTVTGVSIDTIWPGPDSTYQLGNPVVVTVQFDTTVTVTGTPRVVLWIAAQTRYATYQRGSTTNSLVFEYRIAATDTDTDGISIGANALTLNGGTIRYGSVNAVLGLGTHAITNSAAHKVAGNAPRVATLTLSSPVVGDTFERGETIGVTILFSASVTVTGTPQVGLGIGSQTRPASYASGTGSNTLVFEYTVVAADVDADGVSVGLFPFVWNGGTIRAGSVDAGDYIGGAAITNSSGHKVAGNTFTTPSVTDVTITSEPLVGDSVYRRDAVIEAAVAFSRPVAVTGTPQLALAIGSATRQANYVSASSTADTLVFRYTVVQADADADGLSIGAGALGLNGGTINDTRPGATAASLGLGTHAVANAPAHKVDGSQPAPVTVTAVSLNQGQNNVWLPAFVAGDWIQVTVTFSAMVNVTGTPQVALRIGSAIRQADYYSGTGTTSLVFRYRVHGYDSDNDGFTVASDALALNGGAIRPVAGGNQVVALGLPSSYTGQPVRTRRSAPSSLMVSMPSSGNTWELDDTITVEMGLSETAVSGAPHGTSTLKLIIGANTRRMRQAGGAGSYTRLTFRYVIGPNDVDADGISIPADAWTGGTFQSYGSIQGPFRSLGALAFTNDGDRRVNGEAGSPVVRGVSVGSPPTGDTFERADVIEIAVAFTAPLAVTGTPQLALTIGSTTRQADYASGTGTDTLVFRYTVVAADVDTDGLSIGATALALNGGTIRRPSTTIDATLGLGSHAVTNSTNHKVAGGTFTASPVSAVTIASLPATGSDSTYGRTERIEVHVAFVRPVVVTGDAAAGTDDRERDATGGLHERHGDGHAGVPLHGGPSGCGLGRDQHRRERASAEQRHDQRRSVGRQHGGESGAGFECDIEHGGAQGGRQPGAADGRRVVDQFAACGRLVRA